MTARGSGSSVPWAGAASDGRADCGGCARSCVGGRARGGGSGIGELRLSRELAQPSATTAINSARATRPTVDGFPWVLRRKPNAEEAQGAGAVLGAEGARASTTCTAAPASTSVAGWAGPHVVIRSPLPGLRFRTGNNGTARAVPDGSTET